MMGYATRAEALEAAGQVEMECLAGAQLERREGSRISGALVAAHAGARCSRMHTMHAPSSDEDDPSGITELATQSVAPIDEQLRQRLVAEVDDRDALAIETALLKAFFEGMRAASADVAERAINEDSHPEGLGIAPVLGSEPIDPTPLPWIDPWAETYGERS